MWTSEAGLKGIETQRKFWKDKYYENPNICPECGETVPYKKGKQPKFCNHSCAATYNNKKYPKREKREQPRKESKEVRFHRGENLKRDTVRELLFKLCNSKCQICGWGETNPFTGKIPLELHHINNDRSDNTKDNVQLLCPNCHSLTNGFRFNKKVKS